MANLLVGPLLRYVGSTQATVWVETDAPCEVTVLGHRERTFHVEGHHYALVVIDDLEPATATPYDVRLDDQQVWPPEDGRPPSTIYTRNHERQARLVFGSCRIGAPEELPYTLSSSEHPKGVGIDALWAFSKRLQKQREPWPDCLLLLGDQMYADEVSPETLAFARSRRDLSVPPGRAGRRLRGVHAPVPRVVGRPRHPLAARDRSEHDDLRRPRRPRRLEHLLGLDRRDARASLVGGSHRRCVHVLLALPAPREPRSARARRGAAVRPAQSGRGRRPTAASVRAHGRPRVGGEPLGVPPRLRQDAPRGRRLPCGARPRRWPARHGRRRGVGLDRRARARRLRPPDPREHPARVHDGRHSRARGVERGGLCGAWGRIAIRPAEKLRRALDLEHWAAFQRSFATMVELLADLSRRGQGRRRRSR